jgi:hypothetical protein
MAQAQHLALECVLLGRFARFRASSAAARSRRATSAQG